MNKIRAAIFSPKIPDWTVIYPEAEIWKQAEQKYQNDKKRTEAEQTRHPINLKKVHLGTNTIIKKLLILLTIAAIGLSWYGFGGIVAASKNLNDVKHHAVFLPAIPVLVVCCLFWIRENKIQDMSSKAYSEATIKFWRVHDNVKKEANKNVNRTS